ncbi:uncharacterized protein VTP21DRAFT_6041 [Calcarisporiella thermophila]|uniref:uncharacterized protein n=1 Tax=Calcarisporiella thermophila TaxID=911321 RepID=UPI0037436BD3
MTNPPVGMPGSYSTNPLYETRPTASPVPPGAFPPPSRSSISQPTTSASSSVPALGSHSDEPTLPYHLNPHQRHPPLYSANPSPAQMPAYSGGGGVGGGKVGGGERRHMLRYEAPWPIYGLDWSNRGGEESWRIAIGSLVEEFNNKLQIVQLAEEGARYHSDFVPIAEADHGYPLTKVLWEPNKGGARTTDLLATTSDCLRLWELHTPEDRSSSHKLTLRARLTNTKADFSAPLTSFDWCDADPSLVVTCSIDTTCTAWNVETQQAKTQLIAHDREVYDVAFMTHHANVFASVGADGSVRLFDLRSLEHSTIIYETPNPPDKPTPLLRLAFNRQEPHHVSTFHMDSSSIQIFDIRVPGVPYAELRGHGASVNCCGWAPHLKNLVVSGGEDAQVLVWDLAVGGAQPGAETSVGGSSSATGDTGRGGGSGRNTTRLITDPVFAYTAEAEVNQLNWSKVNTDWMAIVHGKTMQALKF